MSWRDVIPTSDPRVRVILLPVCTRCRLVAPQCTCGRPRQYQDPAPKEKSEQT